MKKKILVLALAVVFVSLLALGSAAYFTVEGRATNIITTGTVSLSLDEHLEEGKWTEVKDSNAVTVAWQLNDRVMPGMTVAKKPTLKNDGTQPFFLRAKVQVTVTNRGEYLPSSVVLLQQMPSGWTEQADGWLYYTPEGSDAVAPGAEVVLFDGVKLAEEAGNQYQNSTVTITVQAQAVQVKNNPGETALTAQGWPQENAE